MSATKQLVNWLLTSPENGKSLFFAGPPEPTFLHMSRVKLMDDEGNVWTLTAGLKEGWLTDEQRLQNILSAAKEST